MLSEHCYGHFSFFEPAEHPHPQQKGFTCTSSPLMSLPRLAAPRRGRKILFARACRLLRGSSGQRLTDSIASRFPCLPRASSCPLPTVHPQPPAPSFAEFLGRKAVYLPSGLISVKGSKMRDGTIDVDVATKQDALFTGIAFRIESDANLEIVYLRPGATDTIEAMQYTPRLNGDAIWQLLNTSHEKASAHFPKDSGSTSSSSSAAGPAPSS